jgi:hypothetical protein
MVILIHAQTGHTMTVDDALKLIPIGWRLRLTNWQDPTDSGWGAELFHQDGRRVVDEADNPAEAIRLAAEKAKVA